MNRHFSRIICMQSLFEGDFRQVKNYSEIIARNLEQFPKEVDEKYLTKALRGIKKNLADIDCQISQAAPEWPIEQIAAIDKAILRLATYELLYSDDVPPKVAIDEAVEIAKTFGGENSSKFINGVLGTLYRQSKKYKKENDAKK